MIRLARSERTKRTVAPLAAPLARRFVGGESAAAAVATARSLRDEHGVTASLFYLGEYVSDSAVIEETIIATLAAIELLGSEGLDVNVSVDPTAIGHLASDELCAQNAQRLARAAAAYGAGNTNSIVLDMERAATEIVNIVTEERK